MEVIVLVIVKKKEEEEKKKEGDLSGGVTVPLEVLARCEVASFSSAELQLDYYL